MRFFDLHSDTLYEAVMNKKSLDDSSLSVSFTKGKNSFSKWRECTAIWIPDNLSPSEGYELFLKGYEMLGGESKRLNVPVNDFENADCSFVFTLENGKIIDNKLERIGDLSKFGVKMITLTWNDENCIGGGADAQSVGLKAFGRECIREMEDKGIAVDISHASDKLFYDVASIAEKPLVASHSNARSICNHRRNLTDEQIIHIIKTGGLIGLNFCEYFLTENEAHASIGDVIKHAYHILSLGGENTLAIGSDFDGAPTPPDLDSIDKIPKLAQAFKNEGFNEQIIQKIMYDNAHNFFCKF